METISETSFEKEWRLWRKGERVAFKAYPKLEGIVEGEARIYPFVLWPGEEKSVCDSRERNFALRQRK